MIEVAGVQLEMIAMHRDARLAQIDGDLDPVAFGPCGKSHEGVFIPGQFGEYSIEALIGHEPFVIG